MIRQAKHVLVELACHAPFTAIGTLLGVAMVAAFALYAPIAELHEAAFHVLHPLHMLLSALATAAVYYKHRDSPAKALVVGVAGSIGICSLSDIFLPYLGGVALGIRGLRLHVCLAEHPWLVVPPAIAGSAIAIPLASRFENASFLPHGGHVMVSVLASMTYLSAFAEPLSLVTSYALQASIVVFLAVLLPCCTSDIVLPVAAAGSVVREHVHVVPLVRALRRHEGSSH